MESTDIKGKMVKVYLIEYWGVSCKEGDTEQDLIDCALNRSFGKHEYDVGMGKVEILHAEVVKDEADCNEEECSCDGTECNVPEH